MIEDETIVAALSKAVRWTFNSDPNGALGDPMEDPDAVWAVICDVFYDLGNLPLHTFTFQHTDSYEDQGQHWITFVATSADTDDLSRTDPVPARLIWFNLWAAVYPPDPWGADRDPPVDPTEWRFARKPWLKLIREVMDAQEQCRESVVVRRVDGGQG